jgi:hypothetical protein
MLDFGFQRPASPSFFGVMDAESLSHERSLSGSSGYRQEDRPVGPNNAETLTVSQQR